MHFLWDMYIQLNQPTIYTCTITPSFSVYIAVGGIDDGDDIVRFALTLLDHVKTTRLTKEVCAVGGCG